LRPRRFSKYDGDCGLRQTSFAALRPRQPSNYDGDSRQTQASAYCCIYPKSIECLQYNINPR
jgi:hypothetical protein